MEPFEIIKIAHSSMPKEITLGNLKESDKTCVSVNFILGNEE